MSHIASDLPSTALAAWLDSLPEPHIVFDGHYRILAANAAYRAQFSPRGSVIGRTCHEVSHGIAVPCDQAGESCPLARARQSGQRERVLHLHHTPRGEAYVQIELVPLRDPQGEQAWFIEKMEPLRVAQSAPAASGLIGRAPAFQAMLELVARVGPSEAAVLLLGESGTGKELVARAVHEASTRAARPLVVVDCASLPETLFESELFGHEKGAFTGAQAARAGLVEAASGGTLFLDEVGDIPLAMQVKLLRLLESGTYRRVGSSELRRADVRLVSATHRDLPRLVAEGRFREDLFHRLATFPIRLPALRERLADLEALVESLSEDIARRSGLPPRSLSPEALALLARRDWPGNIRELRNALEQAALMTDDLVLEPRHFSPSTLETPGPAPSPVAAPPPVPPQELPRPAQIARTLAEQVAEVEHAAIALALRASGGNRAQAARQLGMSRAALYDRLSRWPGLEDAC